MINGVTVLATNVVTMTNPILTIIVIALAIIAGLGLLFILFGNITDCLGIVVTGFITIITAFIILIICIPIDAATQVPAYNTYEVIIDDFVSINEFMGKYEILEQRDKIYVIKEKEN